MNKLNTKKTPYLITDSKFVAKIYFNLIYKEILQIENLCLTKVNFKK